VSVDDIAVVRAEQVARAPRAQTASRSTPARPIAGRNNK
jgi:hypothetical protein